MRVLSPLSKRAEQASAAPEARSRALVRGLALDLLLVLLLVGLALPYRLANVDSAAAKSDEGIRLEQLFLMSVGFRPVREIFASQGPLSLDATYPLYALLGGSLAAARLAVAAYSLAELAACYVLASQLGGRLGGLVAGLLLALSPVYLENSRTALVEVPALLPATLAIAAALRFAATGRRRWLLAAALLLTLALLVKPIVLAAGLPVLLALLARRERRWRSLLLAAVVGGALALAVVLLAGPAQLYDQVVRYRVGSAEAEGWSLAENLDILADELRAESPAWLGLALAAAPLSLLAGARAVPALAWAAATLALLLVYSPLMDKHAVVLVAPVAALVGCAAGGLGRSLRSVGRPALARYGPAAVGLALAIWYAASLPAILAQDRRVANAGTAGRDDPYADEVALVTSLTGPDDYILVDEPYLAYLSRRRVPPSLADPTVFRLRSGTLSSSEVIEAATTFDVRAMLLWSDGLRDLKKFGDWADDYYRPVKIYERRNGKDRALYLREDADLDAARRLLRAGLTDQNVDFSGQVRLAGVGLAPSEVKAGTPIGVATEWEALANLDVDYHVLAILTSADGRTVAQSERSLGGGGAGTSVWTPGRWTIRTFQFAIPSKTPPGRYTLALALYDSEAKQRLPLAGVAGDEAAVATVTVR